ncbi:EamA family transporter [Pelagicoccus sp. SDUM812003]|uniref:EamA family transporter n=1 Tax=Pelagicoccus sp. SDUM812003 TaxID=3041267 RepID=UPI0028102C3E|nr:EamA family transporter [Pelagicoccus sp. SDUM812003]MDQ8205209.1 EamA family transporter [Pelagicoccus sp. SDUM812003]
MTWLFQALASAAVLGLYDVFKKRSVNGNAVVPTLFLSVCFGALIWAPWVIWCAVNGVESAPMKMLQVQDLSWLDHGRLLLKSTIVAISWVFSYFALKHLPVSVAGGIRATSPFWTLFGAVVLFAERPSGQQWLGIVITLISFVALSFAGRREGLVFHRDRWVFLMIGATLAGTVSGLYDKYLMGTVGYEASTVQAWFSIYLVLVMLPMMIGWWRRWWPRGIFVWRWSIPMIGVSLLIADYLYFEALRDEEALISIVSCLRRGGVLVSFAAGYILFKERNYRAKTPCILGILLGIVLISLA